MLPKAQNTTFDNSSTTSFMAFLRAYHWVALTRAFISVIFLECNDNLIAVTGFRLKLRVKF